MLHNSIKALARHGFDRLERFPAKACPHLDSGVDAGWREENASKQEFQNSQTI